VDDVKRWAELLDSGEHGEVIRAKALLRTADGMARADYVPGRMEITPFIVAGGGQPPTGKAVVIGEGLDDAFWQRWLDGGA